MAERESARAETTVGLRQYVDVLRRRKWLVLQAVIVVTGAVLVASLLQPTRYEATARVMAVGQTQAVNVAAGTNLDSGDIDERQLQTLASFVATPEIAKRAAEQLGRPGEADALIDNVSAETDPNADIILVTGDASDASGAAAIANAFADQFVAWRRETQQASIQEALDTIDEQIAQTTTGTLQRQLLNERRNQLEVIRTLLNGGVVVGEVAGTPSSPSAPKPLRNAALAVVAGLVLGIGLAFVREALDVQVRSADQVATLTDVPIIGAIPELAKQERTGSGLVALDDPRGPTAEAFRFLRTNLDFVNFNRDVKAVLITSPGPSQGKSTTIANLAVALLRAGKRVAVIEGDLRRPALHRFFKIANSKGVTTVVSGATSLTDAAQVLTFSDQGQGRAVTTASGRSLLTPPGIRASEAADLELTLLPSGPLPPNPGEIVSSTQLADMLESLKRDHDYVLVDAPPMFAVGDAAAMADKVDGIIAIIRLGETTQDTVRNVDDFLRRLPTRTLGLVITGVPRGAKSRYYRYDEYYE